MYGVTYAAQKRGLYRSGFDPDPSLSRPDCLPGRGHCKARHWDRGQTGKLTQSAEGSRPESRDFRSGFPAATGLVNKLTVEQ